MSFLYTKLPDKLLGKLGKIWWELWPVNFWANFIKFLPSYGPLLGASICWRHSVLQMLAPFFFFFCYFFRACCVKIFNFIPTNGSIWSLSLYDPFKQSHCQGHDDNSRSWAVWLSLVCSSYFECRTLFFKWSFKNQLLTKELSKTGWRSLRFYQICYKPLVLKGKTKILKLGY